MEIKSEDIIIIDDFLYPDDFKTIQSIVMGNEISWKFTDAVDVNDKQLGKCQFVHNLYTNYQITSDSFWDIMPPILYNIGSVALIGAKINLQPKDSINSEKGFHVDYGTHTLHRTAILCMNTCNGSTRFRTPNVEVPSVANRLIDFPSGIEHTGVSQTDEISRVVFNINYYPHEHRVLEKSLEPVSNIFSRMHQT